MLDIGLYQRLSHSTLHRLPADDGATASHSDDVATAGQVEGLGQGHRSCGSDHGSADRVGRGRYSVRIS